MDLMKNLKKLVFLLNHMTVELLSFRRNKMGVLGDKGLEMRKKFMQVI